MLETIKLKLIKLLINSTFKYNNDECRDKWLETTMDDLSWMLRDTEQYLTTNYITQIKYIPLHNVNTIGIR